MSRNLIKKLPSILLQTFQSTLQAIKFAFFLDRKAEILLCVQTGSSEDQLKMALICMEENNFVEAYAWAEVALYQGLKEAEIIKNQAWDKISPHDRSSE